MRISTISLSSRVETNILGLQRELSKVQNQVSSGKISNVFSGLTGEDARVSIQLRAAMASKESFIETVEKMRLRTAVTDASLLQLQESANEMRVELIKQTDSLFVADLPVMNKFADNAIDRFASLLNTKVAGRFAFSGPATSTQPIIDATTIKTNFQGAVNTVVNAGSNTAAQIIANANTHFNTNTNWNNLNAVATNQESSVHADVGLDISYGEMAHQEAFADVFEIMNIFANVSINTGDEAEYRTLVDSARTTIEGAFNSINQMIADLGVSQARLNAIEQTHKDDLVMLGGQLGNVEDVDSFEAVNLFQNLRNQIEMSYQVTAATRNLSLVNFI
ncbi:MAG: flagellin [Alphaproteobacteria bacterium]|nr:flagellin [Alphaproteobacteria bacterium]